MLHSQKLLPLDQTSTQRGSGVCPSTARFVKQPRIVVKPEHDNKTWDTEHWVPISSRQSRSTVWASDSWLEQACFPVPHSFICQFALARSPYPHTFSQAAAQAFFSEREMQVSSLTSGEAQLSAPLHAAAVRRSHRHAGKENCKSAAHDIVVFSSRCNLDSDYLFIELRKCKQKTLGSFIRQYNNLSSTVAQYQLHQLHQLPALRFRK